MLERLNKKRERKILTVNYTSEVHVIRYRYENNKEETFNQIKAN